MRNLARVAEKQQTLPPALLLLSLKAAKGDRHGLYTDNTAYFTARDQFGPVV